MKKIAALLGAVALIAGGVAVAAYATPPAGGPPGQGDCSHGNTGKDCKPDPQPGHGQDCDEHGPKNGGVNEDHCLPEETTPTDTNPGGGHTPVVICHKGDTITVDDDAVAGHLGHGDTIGECETETTPTETTPTTPTPPVTPPGHDCTFVGADKDGGHDAYGGTNDDCAPAPQPPSTPVTPAAAAPPAVAAPVTTTVVTSAGPVSKPPAKQKPKAKPAAKPKPDKPPTVVKVTKKKHGVVVIKTSDGKTHTGIMGSG